MPPTNTPERRNDIGGKFTNVIAFSIITLFVGVAWATANQGNEKATKNSERIAIVETYFKTMTEDVSDIKDILKDMQRVRL